MKKVWILIAVVSMMFCVAQPVVAADVTAAVDFNSAYVWRGMTFNDGMVAQPSIDVAAGGFGFNVWGNIDIDDYDDTLDSGEFSEVDLTASYGFTLGMVDVGVGYIEYLFPTTEVGGLEGSREIYLSLGTGLPAGFSVALDVYYDIDEMEEYYSVLGVSYAYDINEQLSLEAGASIAYAGDKYCGDDSAGFYDFNLSLSIGYAITETLGVSASINYVDSVDDDNLVDVDDDGYLDVKTYGGVGISYAF